MPGGSVRGVQGSTGGDKPRCSCSPVACEALPLLGAKAPGEGAMDLVGGGSKGERPPSGCRGERGNRRRWGGALGSPLPGWRLEHG